jgi:hypothetical protein
MIQKPFFGLMVTPTISLVESLAHRPSAAAARYRWNTSRELRRDTLRQYDPPRIFALFSHRGDISPFIARSSPFVIRFGPISRKRDPRASHEETVCSLLYESDVIAFSSGSWKYTDHDPVGMGWVATADGLAAAAANERMGSGGCIVIVMLSCRYV